MHNGLVRRSLGLAALAVLLMIVPTHAATTARGHGIVQISNEQTVTRWAHPGATYRVRVRPSLRSRPFARLHLLTEDGFPEVYLALATFINRRGQQWVEVRVPMRPNGRVGWVPRQALGDFHTVHTQLVVDRHRLLATLYDNGREIWQSPVGVGKRSTPTPPGRFYIRERIKDLQGGTIYGPYAFGTSDYSTLSEWPGGGVVGIHGTNQPQLIPGRPSHGCIRIPNGKDVQLWRLMPVGTPLLVV